AAGRVRPVLVDSTDTGAVAAACAGAALLCLETMTNPLLGVPDLPAVIAVARAQGVPVMVDNTFATPCLARPLTWGADWVVHSATKYIGGHSDLLLGMVVVADAARLEALRAYRTHQGANPGQLETWLALRGLRTLPLRVRRQVATAAILAARLATHPAVRAVHHPSLPGHPQHALARRLMPEGGGATVAVELQGTAEAAEAVCRGTRLWRHATSLGGVESTLERRARWVLEGYLPATLLRLSVGIEDPDDLYWDLGAAFAAAGLPTAA
ncbi:MAG TPA: PLP-dependent transferase, partial [Candidatus Dormibacteraeota bacterium]|nr:PLP-dependent transferase [Candidatus Dormibacteraeota bacterium]